MKSHLRGAALLETALILPVLLIALYGVTWGVRVGAISERAESAVRYAGVISQQQSPFNDYSFYALYNNLGATNNVNPEPCQSPPSAFLLGGDFSVVPGTPTQTVVAPTFWQPDPSSVQSSCVAGASRITVAGTDLSRAYIMLLSQPMLEASVSDNFVIGANQLPTAQLQTSTRFYRSPDIATLMHCESALSDPVSASLQPPSLGTIISVPALTSGDLALPTIGATTNCSNPTTYQTPAPAPSPSPTQTGSIVPPSSPEPTSSPSPSGSPTPRSSAAPSAGPSTSPSTVPSPSSSPTLPPTATTSPTPTPSPTPTTTPGSSPTPVPIVTATPQPTPTPTAKPTSTAKPSPKPTIVPTATPTPRPNPSSTGNPSPTPSPTPKPSPTLTATPTPKPTTKPTPKPSASPSPRGSPSPSPSPTSNGTVS